MPTRYAWLLLIFLSAAFLRLAALTDIPPGLTHDEADHGLDAWGVVNGVRPIYFSVGFGREPLYDYATAGVMSFLGPSYLAGRLTATYFSLILIAGAYAWVRRTFDNRTALLTAAGLAVSFWAVMTGRQALRSITLPAMFVFAAIFFWRGIQLQRVSRLGKSTAKQQPLSFIHHPIINYLVAGIFLGITFYAYIPARVLWVAFPALLLFMVFFNRPWFVNIWPGTLLMLILAALIALPLFVFLATNPGIETRLDQLVDPLTAAGQGQLQPLLANVSTGLKTLFISGDNQWRYNIPGRPFLTPIMALFFVAGLALALWWVVAGIREKNKFDRAAAAFFALVWLFLGLSPVLATGVELSTTRIIGLQPVLYLFPVIALLAVFRFFESRISISKKTFRILTTMLLFLLFASIAVRTVRDYFYLWANAPEVRVQYESAMVSAINYLNEFGRGAAAISTTTPNKFHSPAVALLTLNNPSVDLRWFNGKHSLLLPQGDTSTQIFTGFAPLNPHLDDYYEAISEEVDPLRLTDLDRPLTIITSDNKASSSRWHDQFSTQLAEPAGEDLPALFGESAELIGYDLQTSRVKPGEEVRLVTLWRVGQPLDDAVLFSQVLDDNQPVAQADRLDAPSHFWHDGDFLIQLHQFQLPEALSPGDYPLIIGMYTLPNLDRLPIEINEAVIGDHLMLTSLQVTP